MKSSINEAGMETLKTEEITLKEVRNFPKVRAYIDGANELLSSIGYTEHGHRHAGIVAAIARNILLGLNYSPRQAELAAIAGYMHDIGNMVHREGHPQISAVIALSILEDLNLDPKETAAVVGAVGNHEEPEGEPINVLAAAVIIADKSDVHYSRVQNPDPRTYDIHDRVNKAVVRSRVNIAAETKTIELDIEVDTQYATVMEYFEIFVQRMAMCSKAAKVLDCEFHLIVNGTQLG